MLKFSINQIFFMPADDNFPLANFNQLSQSTSSSASSESSSASSSASAEKETDRVSESVGRPLTKMKGKQIKEQESSKAVELKDDKNESEVKIGKNNEKKKPNLVVVKGKKFGEHKNNGNGEDDENRESQENKQRKIRKV